MPYPISAVSLTHPVSDTCLGYLPRIPVSDTSLRHPGSGRLDVECSQPVTSNLQPHQQSLPVNQTETDEKLMMKRVRVKQSGLLALSAASLVLASCASLTPPVRPACAGADMVDTAQASQLVGNWTVTNLNPYPDSGTQAITIRYLADGTLQGEIMHQGEAAAALGNMQFMLTGEWQLYADTLTHRNAELNTSGPSS